MSCWDLRSFSQIDGSAVTDACVTSRPTPYSSQRVNSVSMEAAISLAFSGAAVDLYPVYAAVVLSGNAARRQKKKKEDRAKWRAFGGALPVVQGAGGVQWGLRLPWSQVGGEQSVAEAGGRRTAAYRVCVSFCSEHIRNCLPFQSSQRRQDSLSSYCAAQP